MGRYVLFGYDFYYPQGGWKDFLGYYDTLEEATTVARQKLDDHDIDDFHMVDLTTGERIG